MKLDTYIHIYRGRERRGRRRRAVEHTTVGTGLDAATMGAEAKTKGSMGAGMGDVKGTATGDVEGTLSDVEIEGVAGTLNGVAGAATVTGAGAGAFETNLAFDFPFRPRHNMMNPIREDLGCSNAVSSRVSNSEQSW